MKLRLGMAAFAAMALLSVATVAMAAAPANDNLDRHLRIQPLPFGNTYKNFDATVQPGEPLTTPVFDIFGQVSQPCVGLDVLGATLWYSIKPGSGSVTIDTYDYNGDIDVVVAVYKKTNSQYEPVTNFDQLQFVGCANANEELKFASSGGTYLIQAGGINGDTGKFMLLGKVR